MDRATNVNIAARKGPPTGDAEFREVHRRFSAGRPFWRLEDVLVDAEMVGWVQNAFDSFKTVRQIFKSREHEDEAAWYCSRSG